MDIEKKKKIAIIASIIGGSVIVLALCIWALVAAFSGNNSKRNVTPTILTTPSETPEETPSVSPSATPTIPIYTVSPSPTLEATKTTPPTTTENKTAEPTPTPTPKSDLDPLDAIGKIEYDQTNEEYNGYRISKGLTNLKVTIPVKYNGEIFIIAANADQALDFDTEKVMHIANFGGDSRILDDARSGREVTAGNQVSFDLLIENKKVDIFIVAKTKDGRTFKKPLKTSFTPVAVPSIVDKAELKATGNGYKLDVKTNTNGYVNVLIVNSETKNKLTDIYKIIDAMKNPGNNQNELSYYRSGSSSTNHSFDIAHINEETINDYHVIIVAENSKDNALNSIYSESRLMDLLK